MLTAWYESSALTLLLLQMWTKLMWPLCCAVL